MINQHSTVINNIADIANGGYMFVREGDKIIQVRPSGYLLTQELILEYCM